MSRAAYDVMHPPAQDCLNFRLSSSLGVCGDAEAVFPEKALLIRDKWRKKARVGMQGYV